MRECCCGIRRRWKKGLPNTFGCGCTLRTGAYVVSALSIVYALLIAGAPVTLGVCGYRLCKKLDGGLVGDLIAWIAAALLVLSSLLLAVGASTGRRELILPWLLFSSLYVVLWLIAGFVGLIVISVEGAYLLAAAAFFVSLNMAVLPLYFLLTVTSLYVRIGDERSEAAERALGGAASPPAMDGPPEAAAAAAAAAARDGPTL